MFLSRGREPERKKGKGQQKEGKGGNLASGRLIFRAINVPVLILSLLSKRTGAGFDTSDLLQVPDDGYEIDLCDQRWGHLFHSRDPAHTVYMCLPPKMPVKISLRNVSLTFFISGHCNYARSCPFYYPPSIDGRKLPCRYIR